MRQLRSVCVYAGSSPGARPEYRDAAVELAEALVRHNIELVYGGASVGLMGVLADAVLSRGGRATGVITQALVNHDIAHRSLSVLETVGSMHERKFRMAELADAFIMLPGGLGTYEEFMEVVTWTQLGVHAKPCGILNTERFFGSLIDLLDRAVQDRFVRPEHAGLIITDTAPERLLQKLRDFRPPTLDKWLDRTV